MKTPEQFQDQWNYARREEQPSLFLSILFELMLETFRVTRQIKERVDQLEKVKP